MPSLLAAVKGEYSHFLNSEDLHDPGLALDKCRAKGGTMLLWRSSLDPFVSILPSSTPAILPMLLKLPKHGISCHIVIYLPTSGHEPEFVAAIASLDFYIEEINLKYDGCPIFIRGDANVNPNNVARASLFRHFLDKHNLLKVDLNHPTYHHFIGDGAWDSALDVLLYQNKRGIFEDYTRIICRLTNPLLNSHHDVILSSFHLPPSMSTDSS